MFNDRNPGSVLRSRSEELWDKWALAALEVQLAFEAWKAATRDIKSAAYLGYRAALDREEQAAERLAQAHA
jgi:hypothetical protein